ncbi:hypothetical protein NGM10_00960 [Halorussus salilacus]|uniref:hypothetical protein n=1 Tax=Halorussus salilacus TaxID=2953750 RepID=UPI00209DA46D|nr:hypothetical protein [Halorussus salilacus]USZ68325.1 hypothetical protein NGM10_00960 [Halorussus salilacus]
MAELVELERAVIEALSREVGIKSVGALRNELRQEGYATEMDYDEVHDLLEYMRERGYVELAHGEWGEYTLPASPSSHGQ